jgi:hypothetical protein
MIGARSQEFIPISNIRDGVVILNNGEYRVVLLTSSQNLALKSDDEQMAIVTQFQNYLNSLDFPTEIQVQSRRLDIKNYVTSLEEAYKGAENDLLKIQITEYIDFIKKFTSEQNIMTKRFFVIIPYTPALIGKSLLNFTQKSDDEFPMHREQIMERAQAVKTVLYKFDKTRLNCLFVSESSA